MAVASDKSLLPFVTGFSFPGELLQAALSHPGCMASLLLACFYENMMLLSQINHISLHRLKKIQEKKKVLKEKSEKERELRRAAGGEREPANLLAEEKDEDLLFE